MTTIFKTARLPYAAEKVKALVDDVERYAEFLPWCERVLVQSKTETEVHAEVAIGWQGLSKKFTTCNTTPEPNQIRMSLVSGPFEHLEGVWNFEPVGEECQVSLNLDFQLKSPLFQRMLEPVLSMVTEKIFKAFCDRAKVVC